MKQTFIKLIIILSLFLSSTSASLVHAQTVNNLVVTGSVTVLPSSVVDYSGVTGTYTYGGTYNSHNYWSHTDGGHTYYIYYNGDPYYEWEIFTALTPTNEDYLFFGSNTTDPTLCPTWTSNGTYYSTASISVNEETATPVPEINITGNGFSILDGNTSPNFQYHTSFVSTNTSSGTNTRTYTIVNSGTGTLSITSAAVSGTDFTISTPPALTVASGSTTTFSVTFNPTTVGTKTATVTITNNDSSEASYDFIIDGYA